MRNAAFVFITLIVGTLASPTFTDVFSQVSEQQTSNERIVTGQIIEAIENLARQIREAGLDPLNVDLEASYELPVPVLFSANAIIDKLVFKGLSNIVVQSMNFSILQNRLTFNIVLPGLSLSIDNASADAIVFGENYEASASGSLRINEIRLIGDIRVNVGIISGISIRSISLQFSIRSIESNLNIKILGRDLTTWINNLLGTRLPGKLTQYQREINQLLEIVVLQVVNEALNPSFYSYSIMSSYM